MKTLGHKFAERLKEVLTTSKEFKRHKVVIDSDVIEEDGSGMWDIAYKGMVFSVEWYFGTDKKCIWVVANCHTVETIEGDICVEDYWYHLDDIRIEYDAEIDESISGIVDFLTGCFVADNINAMYKKAQQLSQFISNLDGNAESNKWLFQEILRRENIIYE